LTFCICFQYQIPDKNVLKPTDWPLLAAPSYLQTPSGTVFIIPPSASSQYYLIQNIIPILVLVCRHICTTGTSFLYHWKRQYLCNIDRTCDCRAGESPARSWCCSKSDNLFRFLNRSLGCFYILPAFRCTSNTRPILFFGGLRLPSSFLIIVIVLSFAFLRGLWSFAFWWHLFRILHLCATFFFINI
jgi:hypothetical protein